MYAFFAQLLEPYTFLLLGLTVLTIVAWRAARPRRRLLTAALGILFALGVLSTPFVSHLTLRTLEGSYPAIDRSPDPDDTIVVLGSSLVTESAAAERVRLGNSTITRCLYAARLYKEAGRCHVIVAGGRMSPLLPKVTLAATMRDFLVDLGVSADDIELEQESTTTWENATRIKSQIESEGDPQVWLVTEAVHMRRAEKCFRAQGIDVLPAPCGHRAMLLSSEPSSFLPSSGGISQVDQVAHEWVGIAWYWLCGRF